MKEVSTENIIRIAEIIKKKIFFVESNFKTTIFLCGAHIHDETKFRYKVSDYISQSYQKYFYDLLFPEEIFEDFLYRSNQFDLLSLEDILANSVDVVIVIPESPGSFAELGAFAGNKSLRDKLICIVDKKYKKEKSFLNYGPVKLIKKVNSKNLIFFDFEQGITRESFKTLSSAIKRVGKNRPATERRLHFLEIESFLLPLIYLLEPISKDAIRCAVKAVLTEGENYVATSTIALRLLLKKNRVEKKGEKYILSSSGLTYYTTILENKKINSRFVLKNELDKIRVQVLNFQLRNKRITI